MIMLDRLQARKHALQHEMQQAEAAIAETERRHGMLVETRLRISGALLMLDELIAEAQTAQGDNNA